MSYQEKEELKTHLRLKQELKTLLNRDTVVVTFVKANGEIRKMTCTTKPELLPPSSLPVVKPGKKIVTENLDSLQIRAFDLTAQGWRSFLISSVISVYVPSDFEDLPANLQGISKTIGAKS